MPEAPTAPTATASLGAVPDSAAAAQPSAAAAPAPVPSSAGLEMAKTPAPAAPADIPGMPKIERGSSFLDSIGQFWKDQTPTGKLAIGQMGSGLISGVGQGALRYMGAADQREYEQKQLDQRRRDRAFVPDLTPVSR